MNRTQIVYLIALYALVIGFGLYLNTASGQETSLSCQQYLNICEKSCAHRDGMFRFLCLGKEYNQDLERYRCQCGDELREIKQVAKTEPGK